MTTTCAMRSDRAALGLARRTVRRGSAKAEVRSGLYVRYFSSLKGVIDMKTMRSMSKRLLSLILAVALLCTIAVPAVSADEVQSGDGDSGESVWLHVINGNFGGSYGGKSGAEFAALATVEVELQEDRTLPEEVENIAPTRTGGTFDGWYTKSPSEVQETRTDDNGKSYTVWSTKGYNGTKIEIGETPVPEDVTVLYAVFKDKEEIETKDKLVTLKLNWNGMFGKNGSLRLTRKLGDKFTTEDAAVFGLNFSYEYEQEFEDGNKSWDTLKQIWAKCQIDGYTFKGWAKDPKAEDHDASLQDKVIENGEIYYAVWEKNDKTNTGYDSPVDDTVGPLDFLQILGKLDTATKTATVAANDSTPFTLTLQRSPLNAKADNVTWTVSVTKSPENPENLKDLVANKPTVVEVEAGANEQTVNGIKVKAVGLNLTLTSCGDKAKTAAYSVTVSAKATGTNGVITTNADATVRFVHIHKWAETDCHKDATCTEAGYACYQCSDCQENNREDIPALGHTWETQMTTPISCVQNKVVKRCSVCGNTETSLVPARNKGPHKWGEWYPQKEATESAEGVAIRECELCGKMETKTLEKLTPKPTATPSTSPQQAVPKAAKPKAPVPSVKSDTSPETTPAAAPTETPIPETKPSEQPTETPAPETTPSEQPTETPTPEAKPTEKPTETPTPETKPTETPTETPAPESKPSEQPTETPAPESKPSEQPTETPAPETKPSEQPTETPAPETKPTEKPTETPKPAPTEKPAATQLATPKLLSVKATSATSVTVKWNKVAGAVKYRVFYKTGNGGWKKAGDTASASLTWTKAKAGTKYSFTVRCLDKNGKYVSAYDKTGKSVTTQLATPKLSSVKATSATSVTVKWNKVAGAVKYRVFYKTGNGGWKKAGDTASASLTWTKAKAGTKYSFTVRCLDKNGKYVSAYDKTGKSVTTQLATPTNLKASKSGSAIKVSWSKVKGAKKYRVYYKTGNGSWKKLADTTSTSYTWKKAKAGIKYTFTVRCITKNGKSTTSGYNAKGTKALKL